MATNGGGPYVTIHVIRARGLKAADLNGFSDPYAVLSIDKQRKKTTIIKKTLDPEWNQTFIFEMPTDTITKLFVLLYDWDLGKSDDFLGAIAVDLHSVKMDGSEVWFPLGRRKGHPNELVKGDICLAFEKGLTQQHSNKTMNKTAEDMLGDLRNAILRAEKESLSELDLTGFTLTKIPNSLYTPTISGALLNLSLSFNKFIELSPDIAKFERLEVLDLSGNQLIRLPKEIGLMTTLQELIINGNLLETFPDELGVLTQLQKLYIGNNRVSKISPLIGKLQKLEELSLTGNPISELPPSIGCCVSMEVLDLSCCDIQAVPPEFTYMTRLLELNLGTNDLAALPDDMGRMTRLVVLNLSDNQLSDLPLSMGYCVGLNKFGAGANLERNPIMDEEMLKKYRVGPDHLVDYLEKRMAARGFPKLKDLSLPFPVIGEKVKKTMEPSSPAPAPKAPQDDGKAQANLDSKVNALRKWANTVIQQDLRPRLQTLSVNASKATDANEALKYAQVIKSLKPEIELIKQSIEPFEVPKPLLDIGASKLDQVKAIIAAAVEEIVLVLRGIQKKLDSNFSKEIFSMVQLTKNFKAAFDNQSV